jgi:hypothetical protein
MIEARQPVLASAAASTVDGLLARLGATVYQDRWLPYPLLFPEEDFRTLARAGADLLSAQGKIIRHLLARGGRQALLDLVGLPAWCAPLVAWENLEEQGLTVGRLDVVPTRHGYWFCELNVHPAVGGGEAEAAAHRLARSLGLPPVARVASPFRALADLYRRICRQRDLRRVVILDSATHRARGFPRQELLRRQLRRTASDLAVDLHDEDSYPAAWLSPGEGRQIFVHRMFTDEEVSDSGRFLRQLQASGAVIGNGFEAEARMNKVFLALLCDEAYHPLLDTGERAAIRRFLAPTSVLDESNLAAALAARGERVFKTRASYGGQSVLIGAEHSAEELEARLRAAGLEQWVCQEYREAETIPVYNAADPIPSPHRVVLGLYHHGSVPGGVLVRASRNSRVVNLSNGAAKVGWALVVDEEGRQTYRERSAPLRAWTSSARLRTRSLR